MSCCDSTPPTPPGLLFAYGITNSGKTYTVNGEPEQAGILPRSLDVIFNSMTDVQTPRYVRPPELYKNPEMSQPEIVNREMVQGYLVK